MSDLTEMMIEQAITDSEVETGRPLAWLVAQGSAIRPTKNIKWGRSPDWAGDEDAFVKQHSGTMSLAEMAATLGRSENAIKIHVTRKGFETPRKAAGYLSGNVIAAILGVDSHAPPCWIDVGLLKGERFPYPGRICRRVKIMTFMIWITRPTSWVYFDVRKIQNNHLRRLVELAQERWGDEWLTTRQAADLRGCSLDDVQNSIRHGRLPAYHAGSIDRKRAPGWSYWFVRRSDVGTFEIRNVSWRQMGHWTARADAFIIRSVAAGTAYEDMARMMKWPIKRIQYRVMLLQKKGLINGKKKPGKVSGRISGRDCRVCGKPTTLRGLTCGGDECLAEMQRRRGREQYRKAHLNVTPGRRGRKPNPEKAIKVKKVKTLVLCEICGERPATARGNICNSPECRAERIRRYGRAAYQRRKTKGAEHG